MQTCVTLCVKNGKFDKETNPIIVQKIGTKSRDGIYGATFSNEGIIYSARPGDWGFFCFFFSKNENENV